MPPVPALIVSRSHGAPPSRRAFEEALIAGLRAAKVPVVVAPELSLLRPGTQALAWLRAVRGHVVFLSWVQPRPAYWWLDFLGVAGERASALPADAARRAVVTLCLDELPAPERWVERIAAMAKEHPALLRGTARRLPAPRRERWYPVVDRSRCIQCHQCLEFCIFGVYDLDKRGHLRVAQPDNCKAGCPACSRVCPAQAISFPLYADDPGIAGVEGATIEWVDPLKLRRARERHMRPQAAPAAAPAPPAEAQAESRDYFDDLIERIGRE